MSAFFLILAALVLSACDHNGECRSRAQGHGAQALQETEEAFTERGEEATANKKDRREN